MEDKMNQDTKTPALLIDKRKGIKGFDYGDN